MRGVLNVLNVVLEHAVKQEYVASKPGAEAERREASSEEQARRLGSWKRRKSHCSSTMRPRGTARSIFTAVYTGMRQSELLGLRWEDVDFDAGTIHLRHQLSRATKAKPARVVAAEDGCR